MKRLLALLLLAVSPAFAQQYTPGPYVQPPVTAETENLIYTTINTPPDGAQYTWAGFVNTASNGGGFSGGNVPAYNSSTGTFLFGYTFGTVTYRLTNSSEFPSPGTEIDSFKYSWEYFNQDFSRGSLTANIKFYDPNNSLLENYNFQLGQTTSGWTLFSGQIDFASAYNMSDLAKIEISFTGKDDRFWAGYYGPQIRSLDLSLVYTSAPPPTDFPYWDRLAGENEFFTLTEPGVVRYGANGVYIYAEFQPGTYACTNGDWGNDPIGGVVKSCDFGSTVPPPVAAVDCAVDPYDTSCIIDSLVDTGVVDPVEQAIADATDMSTDEETGSDDGSSDGTELFEEEEEFLVADESIEEETDLETILQDDVFDEEDEEIAVAEAASETVSEKTAEPAASSVAAIADDSKASELADSISKNVLEGALAIAADNTAAGSAVAATSASESSNKTASTTSSSSASVATETAVAEVKSEEINQETNDSSVAAIDILETGRQMGATALAATQASSEASASESVAQAESIAASSSETQTTFASTVEIQTSTAESEDNKQIVSDRTESETTNETTVETSVFVAETLTTEEITAESTVTANIETTEASATFADIMQMEIKPIEERVDADVEFVQQVVAASEQKQEELNNTTFSEEERVTIASDPTLASAFNLAPNITNLEVAGVLSNKQEEKSDAEKRADEVVAANAKEQEEINKNYMDADQSGIVAAMGADTDVGAYRTAMIRDNNNWYKPEDIYKNVVYKDNVRGSYFLEKGNTDTYKKMVEEQYK